jgi:signal transduction histidine kinase
MLYVLIILWLIVAFLLITDAKSVVMRWLSAFIFAGGCGAMAAVLDNQLIPYVLDHFTTIHVLSGFLINLKILGSLTSYYGLPYSYIMLALYYNSTIVSSRMRQHLSYFLLLPIAACLLFTPAYDEVYPITFSIVVWWAVPYLLIGSVIIAMRKEVLPVQKQRHLLTCMVLFPPVLGLAILNYTLPAFDILQMWRYNTYVMMLVVPFFVYTLIKNGFMGIQLFIEGRKLDSTLRAITSGTAILNHSIKNDVGKMRLFGDKIRRHAITSGQTELLNDLNVMLSSTEHIHELIHNVHQRTKDETPVLSEVAIASLVQQVLIEVAPYLQYITVNVSVSEEVILQADAAQLKELLTNLIINAVEAMPHGGSLTITLSPAKKGVILEIKDTGAGIDKKNLRRVLDPFFTTKSSSGHNFGLGLAYSYNVMKRHGGSLQLSSELGKGTTIYLFFAKKA